MALLPGYSVQRLGEDPGWGGHGNPGLAKMDQGQGDVPLGPFQEALVKDELHAKWADVESSYTFTPVPWSRGHSHKAFWVVTAN